MKSESDLCMYEYSTVTVIDFEQSGILPRTGKTSGNQDGALLRLYTVRPPSFPSTLACDSLVQLL